MKIAPIITVFGSSRIAEADAAYREARELGKALAEAGFAVCTGAYGGAMEAISRGAKDAGGKTFGVTNESLKNARANEWVDVEVRKKSWEERLFELLSLGNGFVALPGGSGTLAELSVAWEMMNQGLLDGKPLTTLGNYWEPVLRQVGEAEKKSAGTSSADSANEIRNVPSFATSKELVTFLRTKLTV